MSMLLPTTNPWVVAAASSAPTATSPSSSAADAFHLHSHLPEPHVAKLHQYQPHAYHYHQEDKSSGSGVTINMQSVVDADARRPDRLADVHRDHQAVHLSLPSLLLAQATISPPNTRRYPPVLAPLRVLPDYCRFPGCANFGKMQGFCHDHIHGRPASSSIVAVPQMLPGLRSVVSPELRASAAAAALSSPEPSPSPSGSAFAVFRQQPMFAASALKRPPPVVIPGMASVPAPAFEAASKRPRVQDESDSSCSTASTARPQRTAKCRRESCENDARRKGLCMEHGGRHFCKMAGCTKCAHRGGFCISHGGGRRCAVANCAKSAQSGGICYSHGGGKRCATDGCTHAARSGGFCIKHGKQQRQRDHHHHQQQ